MSKTTKLSAKESVYCPTCRLHTSQSRGYKYGTRYCGICGDEFTLQQSREAEAAANSVKDSEREGEEDDGR